MWRVTFLLRCLEGQGSNLGTEISYNERFSWRSSVTPQERYGIRTLLLEIKSIHKPSNTTLPQPITEVEDIGYIFVLWRNSL
jgi:hypothetical protein